MKPGRILLFMLSVTAILAGLWYVYPAKGIHIGDLTLRFASREADLDEDDREAPDVDDVLEKGRRSYTMLEGSVMDSLEFFKSFNDTSNCRIIFPNGDWTYLDGVFAEFESAGEEGRICRVMHHGDSQIEMDRISGVLREKLQDMFGGSGPGMIPAQQRIATVSVAQYASGAIGQYRISADSLAHSSPHNRYGVMTYYSRCNGSATIGFRRTEHRHAQPKAADFDKVSMLLGNVGKGFRVTLKCDTLEERTATFEEGCDTLTMLSWHLPRPVGKGTIRMEGSAEIYAVTLDGGAGVTVDNNAMRGCDGIFFTLIDSLQMSRSLELLDTRLILLQFGGNAVPVLYTDERISSYAQSIRRQIRYFRHAAPQAGIIFIGPADMCRSDEEGHLRTWPKLEAIVDSLKCAVLEEGGAYWDLHDVMGGKGSIVRWVQHNPQYAGPDYIHFTQKGADIVGEMLFSAIRTNYEFYRLRQELPQQTVEDFMMSGGEAAEM